MAVHKTPINDDGEIINVNLTQYEISQFKKIYNIEYLEELNEVVNVLVKQQFNS
jgi:hypothetical protein